MYNSQNIYNYQNIYEFLYIIISSSISHAILVIGIVYIIFHIVIIKENESQFAKGFIDYLDTYVDMINEYINNDIDIDSSTKKLFTKDINKSNLVQYIPDIPDDIKQKAIENQKNDDDFNKKYFNRSKIILTIMSICLVSFLLFDYMGFREHIKFLPSFGEVILSFFIASVFIIVFEYLFAYKFMYNYLDYHYDKIFTEKLIYPTGENVYNYK